MRLARTAAEEEIARAAQSLIRKSWDVGKVRSLPDDSTWAQTWQLAANQGWFDVLIDEAKGGLGLGFGAAGAILEETGRELVPGPLAETIIVAGLLGPDGIGPANGQGPKASLALRSSPLGDCQAFSGLDLTGGRLTGVRFLVEFGREATILLASATEQGEPVIVSVAPNQDDHVIARQARSLDAVAPRYELQFRGAEATAVLCRGDDAVRESARLVQKMQVLTSSRLLGVCESVLEMTRDYSAQRIQFGKAIGSFQALQHMMADMATMVHGARSICYMAQAALDSDLPDAEVWIGATKAFLSRTALTVLESALQVHGGIGYTSEHYLHLYYKHALTLRSSWGTDSQLLRTLGAARLSSPRA
jgi:alkylation response protein AidB-like acyl-CoA dehydrogenase